MKNKNISSGEDLGPGERAPLVANSSRQPWIDHLRVFAFTLLVLDHSAHAYARHFGVFHFFTDFDRGLLGDIFYLHNNSLIMPLLFFIFGLFVFPSLKRHGFGGYLRTRVPKLLIPYMIGIPFIVPLLSFPRYQYLTNPLMSFGEFWQDVYFQEKLQGGGPFWVLYCLLLFTLIALTLAKIIPSLVPTLGKLFKKGTQRPVLGIALFLILSIVILGGSDLRWGAPWWIGFGPFETEGEPWRFVLNKIIGLFRLQGSRFFLHGLYFTAGIALSASGLLSDQKFWGGLSRRWPLWLGLMLLSGGAYMAYILLYFYDGTYSDVVSRALLVEGKSWVEAWPLIKDHGPLVLIRTSLHGIFCLCQVMAYAALCHRFFAKSTPFLCSLAACSYGIFLLHEVPIIWGQYFLAEVSLPIFLKIILLFIGGGGLTWGVVALMRKSQYVRKILG